ncbi:MAG TPA: energy transducer TonB [Thermoanaerobaculia bacterium]|jgi:TonB family protein|nr:energy transducer TonB [Thermoanaerobaculia bacterium]
MRKIALTFISLLLIAVCAFADRATGWRSDQTAIEVMLQQKRYADARKASIRLTNHMLDHMGVNDEAALLARTVALRAASEDGLGNVDDANWYRQVAKLLDPQVVLPAMTTPVPEPIEVRHVGVPGDAASGKTEAPQRIRKRDPDRPGIVNALGQAMAVIEVAIDVDGVVKQPRIVSSPAPSVSYAALEAVKQWRFRPGTKDGKPVPVLFHLTITMH